MCSIKLVVTDLATNRKFEYSHTFKDMESAKVYRNLFAESVKNHAKVTAHYKL